MNKKGFTLIELMIVVAIIGILSAIAIPKFADLIRKSNEGATRGNLAVLRSALNIYYSEQEGMYPNPADGAGFATVMAPKYMKEIPKCNTALPGVPATTTVNLRNATYDCPANASSWGYRSTTTAGDTITLNGTGSPAVTKAYGDIWVDTSSVDTKNVVWASY